MITKHKVKKTIENEETTTCVCDFCGKDIFDQKSSDEWKDVTDSLGIKEYGSLYTNVQVNMRLSTGYPEAPASHEYEVDVCIPCFKTQILDRAQQFKYEENW